MDLSKKLTFVAENMEPIKMKASVMEYVTSCQDLFDGASFPDGYIWDHNIGKHNNITCMFYDATGVEKIIIQNSKRSLTANVDFAFCGCSARIIDLSGFNPKIKGEEAFSGSSVEEIIGELDLSGVSSDGKTLFVGAENLVEVRFKPNTLGDNFSVANSKLLSDASTQSLIDCLKTVTTSKTLSLSPATYEKLTEEQKAAILNKGWIVAVSEDTSGIEIVTDADLPDNAEIC